LSEVLWHGETEARPADTPERRAHLEQALEALAGRIRDPKVRSEYQRFFQARFRAAFAGPPRGPLGRAGRPARPEGRAFPRRRAVLDAGALLPKILLATVVNHPELLEEVAEELGTVDFSAPELDKVRAAVLEMAAEPALDRGSLESHLKDRGFSAALRAVLNQGVYMHAGFAGPDAPLMEARKGWRHAFGRYCLPRVRAQVREAQRAFAEDGTAESSERLVNLQRHLHELQALVSGADEPPPGGPTNRESRP
jgi:DNA primase